MVFRPAELGAIWQLIPWRGIIAMIRTQTGNEVDGSLHLLLDLERSVQPQVFFL